MVLFFHEETSHFGLRQPECISVARVKGFNKKNIPGFFDLLEKVVDENNVDPL
jgi:hypothetical protein